MRESDDSDNHVMRSFEEDINLHMELHMKLHMKLHISDGMQSRLPRRFFQLTFPHNLVSALFG